MKPLWLAVLLLISTSASAGPGFDLKEFDHLDPAHVVPDKPLKQALTYLKINKKKFPNRSYLTIIDFSQPSSDERLYLIDLKTGEVERLRVSHGQGSDQDRDGRAESFSNEDGSHATSLGFYRTAETYYGKFGFSLKVDGLSPTNSKARDRLIVLHGGPFIRGNSPLVTPTHGCFAIKHSAVQSVISRMKNGALLYAWAGQ